jgi:hypothetical protein
LEPVSVDRPDQPTLFKNIFRLRSLLDAIFGRLKYLVRGLLRKVTKLFKPLALVFGAKPLMLFK